MALELVSTRWALERGRTDLISFHSYLNMTREGIPFSEGRWKWNWRENSFERFEVLPSLKEGS